MQQRSLFHQFFFAKLQQVEFSFATMIFREFFLANTYGILFAVPNTTSFQAFCFTGIQLGNTVNSVILINNMLIVNTRSREY